ncbi:MAG: EamA family transporter [Acidimicrobiales bacterium]
MITRTRATPAGSAVLFTLASFALWALLMVASRIVLVRYQIDPWSFVFIQLIAGGIVLIALSTSGEPADWSLLLRAQTWVYGTLRVTAAAASTAAVVHATVTQAGTLGMSKVVIGVMGARLAFGRRPTSREHGGLLMVIAGITVLIATRLDGGIRNPAVLLMFVSDLAVVVSSLIAEAHPDNNSSNPAIRLRFTGTVLLITAALFLGFRVLQEGAAWRSGGLGVDWGPAVWIGGLVVGILLRGPAMHCSLRAIRLVGAEVYLMVAPSLAFIALIFETIAAASGLIEPASHGAVDIVLMCVIASGVLWVFATRRSADRTSMQVG